MANYSRKKCVFVVIQNIDCFSEARRNGVWKTGRLNWENMQTIRFIEEFQANGSL